MAKTVNSIGQQIHADAIAYQEIIEKKYNDFNLGKLVPVTKDVGEAYLRGYRKYNGAPFVIKLTRQAIAFLYKQMYEQTVAHGYPMSGDYAVGFANFTPEELQSPTKPGDSDPNWKPEKAYQNTVLLGFWDSNKGVVPFKAAIPGAGGITFVDYFDDWNQEWP